MANGTISANTTSYIVTGTDTDFRYISSGSILLNDANLAIGRVMHVTSNVSLLLNANANLAVTNSTFYVNSFVISPPAFEFSYELGRIYANANSNIIYGNGTYFSNTITTGQTLLIPAIRYSNVSASVDKRVGTTLGIVDFVDNNTRLHLRENSLHTVRYAKWTYGDPIAVAATIDVGVAPLSKYADGFHNMVKPMFAAVEKGVFNNVEQVHSYHPPVQDPVTGIMVNVPATTFRKHDVENPIVGNTVGFGTQISNLTLGESNEFGTVTHFRMNNERFGMHPAYVRDSVPYIDQIQAAVMPPEGDDQGVIPSGMGYFEKVKKIYPETMADRIAAQMGLKINRITDDHYQASLYLDQQAVEMSDIEKQNLAQSYSSTATYVPLSQKTLKASGVPISIPGLINAVSTDQTPQKFKPKNYTTPQFGWWNKE
jgi:hypothetical protein